MMTTPVTAANPAYGPGATAPERSGGYASASVDASARAAFRNELRAGVASEAKTDATKARAVAHREQALQLPDPMKALSTVAVAGAMASTPAALNMMREIAVASASGVLSDADRRALRDEYAQLSQQVVTTVGSASANEQAEMRKREEDQQETYRMYRESSDDRRTTLTHTAVQPVETVQHQVVTHAVTAQRAVLVTDGHGARHDPAQSFRTEELHVGTDSYEPVSARQRLSQSSMPETLGHWDTHAETRSISVVEAAQVTRFVEVAQTQLVPPLNAVA
jgi:hypothetical protein